MPSSTSRPGGRSLRYLAIFALVVVAAATYAGLRVGIFLYAEDPLKEADAIFVLGGSRMDRALEAADLFAESYAPLVIVSRQWPDRAMVILEERGIPFLDDADRIQQALVALGLPEDALLVPPTRHDNTAHEAQTVRSLTAARDWDTVIVVSSKYHLRRAGFAMRRELEGTGVQVVMRGTRYDPHDPARWWATRASVRAVVPEIYGYLAYVMGLGA